MRKSVSTECCWLTQRLCDQQAHFREVPQQPPQQQQLPGVRISSEGVRSSNRQSVRLAAALLQRRQQVLSHKRATRAQQRSRSRSGSSAVLSMDSTAAGSCLSSRLQFQMRIVYHAALAAHCLSVCVRAVGSVCCFSARASLLIVGVCCSSLYVLPSTGLRLHPSMASDSLALGMNAKPRSWQRENYACGCSVLGPGHLHSGLG